MDKTRIFTFGMSVQQCTRGSDPAQLHNKKEIKGIHAGKEKIKFSITSNMIYIQNPKFINKIIRTNKCI